MYISDNLVKEVTWPWAYNIILIKYSQNYYFFIFYFVLLEVGTATFKIFCVMAPILI